jgi:hypothetical protein
MPAHRANENSRPRKLIEHKPIAAGIVIAITNPRAHMTEITETHIERENEQAKVESWRLHVLIEAGFPLPLAERLAASEADLHTCADLLRQGCKPATAAEILL